MRGKIVHIEGPYKSENKDGNVYTVFFKMAGGEEAKTHLVDTYRNFKYWKPLLEKGKVLEGLKLISPKMVNADSIPYERKYPDLSSEEEKLRLLSETYLR